MFVYKFIAILIFIVAPFLSVTAGEKAGPVLAEPEGTRAFDDLKIYYSDSSKKPDVAKSLNGLQDADAAKRKSAGRYLLALFEQSFADESNGRAPWKKTPFFGGGSVSDARNFRKELGAAFGKDASSAEALDTALWLLDSEMLAENQAAGMSAMRRIKAPRSAEIFKKLLAQPHPNASVTQGVIEEAALRGMKELAPEITALCKHYRQSVREAAYAAAPKLGVDKLPAFKPEDTFTPWLDGQLKNIAAMAWPELPKDAAYMRFTVAGTRAQNFSGWVLKDEKDSWRVLNTFGESVTLQKKDAKSEPRTLAEDAEELIKTRTGGEKDKHDGLSRRGGLTGQFEPGFISTSEALVGAWSYLHGDKKTAALVLFARIEGIADDRWVGTATRDMLGHVYHQQMLNAFSHERDYAQVLEMAKHLSKPVFDGYQYQERAKQLAAQLEKRGDDFKTLALPEPTAWETQKKTLDRAAQIKYLADRLRLLNCIQMGQPGGVNYEDPQSGEPSNRMGGKAARGVINPYVEIDKMKLTTADLPALVPYLADENFMPTFSYWRDFHPSRTLHQVNWAVANLINNAAKRDLAELQKYFSLDADGKKKHIAGILDWCKANAGKTRDQLLMEIIGQSKDWREFENASKEAIQLHLADVQPAMLKRTADFKDRAGDFAELCYHTDDPAAAAAAREWLKLPAPVGKKNVDAGDKQHFWAALILLRFGDKDKLEGLAELKTVLDKDDGSYWYPRAIEPLLATKKEEAMKLACTIFAKPRFDFSWSGKAVAHRLLLEGREECLNFLLEKLDSTKDSGSRSGEWHGKNVQRKNVEGDKIAELLAELRTDNFKYDSMAPDEDRANAREKLKPWLKEQFALIKAGKKSQIKEKAEPIHVGEWHIDTP